ncbi:MAG: M20 family metallopeptidase, partial [Desulfosarcina sp.]
MDMKTFITGRIDDFLNDLETLVNIDSSSDHLPGIEAVGQFLNHRLEAIGFTARIEKLGDRGVPCLHARNGPHDGPADIMFLGHMDTVFPPGEVKKRPFAIDGDRAAGPGVCDMKGGLLTALHVLEALHHASILSHLSIDLCFNGDEEVGSAASREWIETHARNSRRVFVFEPCRPGNQFVLQRKGGGGFEIHAHGMSAHAGVEPEKGANAAVEIAHQVVAIQQFNDQADAGISVHVTVIRGGEKNNIIPDTAYASVDVRVAKASQIPQVRSYFQSLPQHTHIAGVTVSVSGGIDRPPMEADPKTMQLWGLIEKQARQKNMTIEAISTG